MNLFDRAKSVGLQHVKAWLPNGKAEGSEWVCLNPTRGDKREGSFKINLDSGKWAEFTGDGSGLDAVSFFAYLNYDTLYSRAVEKGYKNPDKAVQTEAAREILKRHDFTYSESADDDFSQPKKKGDYWDGFSQVIIGSSSHPDPEECLRFHEKFFGEFQRYWMFTDKKGRAMFLVARYYDKDGKKNDRPFTVWTNSEERRWRSKNLEGVQVPLYNLPQFEADQNLPILMVEGQKNAEDAKQVLQSDYVCSSVYRSVKKCDLEPLRGRTVYYWFDPDTAGRKKLKGIKDAIADLDVKLIAVHSPVGKEKGWDISDAIKEGWTSAQLREHIEGNQQEEPVFLDDNEFPFRIIGQSATDIYFFPEETTLVMKFKRSALGKANLMNLMARELWGAFYSKAEGGIAWDSAANDMIRRAALAPIYSPAITRGSGAWVENGVIVINTGESILYGGKRMPLFQRKTEFVYEKKKLVPYTTTDPLTAEASSGLLRVVDHIDFTRSVHSRLLAGWLLLAPFGGALNWRPHAWLTGTQGSGKTHVLERIVYPMVGEYGLRGLGTSTTAGIRQGLGNCSICVTIDEAEPDTKKKAELIEDLLSMARQASSGSELSADILHGTQEGLGMQWIVKSMFLFASIGPGLNHTADKSRVSLLKLATPLRGDKENRAVNFKKLKAAESVITPVWVNSFHARTLTILDEVLKAIAIFTEQTTQIMGTQRQGDQYGTLLAGSYMVDHDTAPTAAEARDYVVSFDLDSPEEPDEKEDEELCIDEILSFKIEVATVKMSIGAWLRYWFEKESILIPNGEFSDLGDIESSRVKRGLEEFGVKPVVKGDQYFIYIAIGHTEVKKMLRSTPWVDSYPEIIERVPYFVGNGGPTFFGAINKRYKKFDAARVLVDEVPF